jgi:hypothetical protein
MNEAIAAMVRRVDDPNVRLFRVSQLVDRYAEGDVDRATPDGFHYTAEMHRLIGAALAGEISEWAAGHACFDVGDHRVR